MKKSVFLLLVGGISVACAAQIKSIKFEGLRHLSPQVAQQISGLKVGDQITGENTDAAISNLFAQGYFSDVYISEQGGAVTINVTEKPTIAKVEIKNVVTNDRDKIKELIGLRSGQVYDEVAVKKAEARIKQYYEVKGFFDTVVEFYPKPINEDKSVILLTIEVNRGENIIIDKVNLVGADKLDYDDIEPAIANKEREILGWMWGFNDGKVKTAELPNDANRIQEEYYKKGYLDAHVSAPLLNADMNNYTADLTYYISEGERYTVSSIDIEYPSEIKLDKKDVIDDFKLQSGDKMNSSFLRRDIEKLETLVADQGFAYVHVSPQMKQDREKNTVDIVYVIDPESKVYIRNVTISGNDKTEDKVIRREMYLTEGNLYSKTDYNDSLSALKRTGYFDEVEIKENRVSNDKIDLEVVVKEAPTGSITGGIGYGSDDGLLLSGGISDRNVFGTGLQGDFSVEKSDDALSGRIGLTNPRVFDSEYSLGGMIFANDYDWDDYSERSYGFSLTGGRKLGRYTTANLTYYLEKSRIKGLDAYYAKAGYLDGRHLKSSIIPSITFNNTDDYYLPRSGVIASASLEYAGIGGDIKYTKARGSLNYYFGLRDYIDYDIIFRYKAAAGYILESNKKPPINEKLFLGGIRSIRGYESRSIPKKQICIAPNRCKYIETGGMQSFNNSFELSFPIIDRLKMRFVTFFDYGMIGDDSWNENRRYSTGAGIEWMTPIGPLQLYFAKPLNKKPHDETSTFEFNIGSRFN
ncbi:MAG: outer membrane protein assembly factor BamA [Campylobacter sp.]|nr:outer membrane protein assembly factor BamA [Campylobacter sp.]